MAIANILFVFVMAGFVNGVYNYNQAWAGAGFGGPGYFGVVAPRPPRLPNSPFFAGSPFLPNAPFLPNRPFLPTGPQFITPDDIAKGQGTFNGASVSSSSGFYTDKDGNLVKTGGYKAVTNKDGEVHVFESGNPGPSQGGPEQIILHNYRFKRDISNHINMARFKKMKKSLFDSFKPSNSLEIEPVEPMSLEFEPITPLSIELEPLKPLSIELAPLSIEFEPIKPMDFNFDPIPPMDAKDLNYKPGKHEHYFSSLVSSYRTTFDDNGVKNGTGESETVTDNDGVVKNKITHFKPDNESSDDNGGDNNDPNYKHKSSERYFSSSVTTYKKTVDDNGVKKSYGSTEPNTDNNGDDTGAKNNDNDNVNNADGKISNVDNTSANIDNSSDST